MTCKRCNGNISIQAVTEIRAKRKGLFYWLFCIWVFYLLLWIFAFGIRLVIRIIRGRKIESKIHKMAICQNCGYSWRIR